MSLFPAFARMIANAFQKTTKGNSAFAVFVADMDGDDLWAKYLVSRPSSSSRSAR